MPAPCRVFPSSSVGVAPLKHQQGMRAQLKPDAAVLASLSRPASLQRETEQSGIKMLCLWEVINKQRDVMDALGERGGGCQEISF